ncbi:MAG: helix-turn-helix domain-containing protein [Actinomycetota bacterium]
MSDRLIDVHELSELLGVPVSWVYERTRRGEIPHYKLGRYCKFDPEIVRLWLKSQQKGALDVGESSGN